MLEDTTITSQPFNNSQHPGFLLDVEEESIQYKIPLSLNMFVESDSDIDCSQGLKNLALTDHLIIKSQIVTFLQETSYRFFNNMDQLLFFSHSRFRFTEIFCCRNVPDAVLYICNRIGQNVICVKRKHIYCDRCCCCCCCCSSKETCLLEVTVEAPVGKIIGKVQQTANCGCYNIMSPNDDILLQIFGPKCICCGACNCSSEDYFIFTPDMDIFVGKIKKCPGFLKTSDFSLLFAVNLDVKTKATLLGAIFLIDFV